MDPEYVVMPWYWIPHSEFESHNISNLKYNIAFRAISNTTNERTSIFSLIPKAGVGNSCPMFIFSNMVLSKKVSLISNSCSYIFDFITRKKMGWTNLNFYIVEQLPALPPTTYTPTLNEYIVPRIIELTYTSRDLEPFARDVLIEVGKERWNKWFPQNPIGDDGQPKPFIWDEQRRFDLRCDLDALYFHLYEITREDVDYIMETFPIVKRKDITAHGTYRTKEVIIQKYDDLAKEFIRIMRADLPKKNGVVDWAALITNGENERVEFKSSISWDVQTKQRNKLLEHTIAKTIASFMNTHGGVLFIGIDDSGRIIGLDGDLKLCKGQNEDGLRLRLDDTIKNYLGNKVLPLMKVNPLKENERIYWAIEVQPTVEPVFVTQNGEDEFWIRGTSSSRRLSGREMVEYIEKRKKNGSVFEREKTKSNAEFPEK
jgi:hypothetical protein